MSLLMKTQVRTFFDSQPETQEKSLKIDDGDKYCTANGKLRGTDQTPAQVQAARYKNNLSVLSGSKVLVETWHWMFIYHGRDVVAHIETRIQEAQTATNPPIRPQLLIDFKNSLVEALEQVWDFDFIREMALHQAAVGCVFPIIPDPQLITWFESITEIAQAQEGNGPSRLDFRKAYNVLHQKLFPPPTRN